MQQPLAVAWDARRDARPSARAPRWLPWRPWRFFALRSDRVTGDQATPQSAQAQDYSADATPSDPARGFEAFYRQHERAIFGYLWRMTGDEQTANDLTQETFFRAWRQFQKLLGYERPEAWLFRVASNLALNERRHQRVAGPAASLHDAQRADGDHAAQFAERTALANALAGLPAQQRAAFILREIYGQSCDEIAETLGLSRAAAKMTLSRARARLRALYLKEDAE